MNQETATQKFDIIIIGGGPGGYPAAIKAAQLGKKVALVEAKQIGGTCLNRGCIPSKALISNAETLEKVRHAKDFGIQINDFSFDYGEMVTRKDEVVAQIRKNVEALLASNKITIFRGFGKLASRNTVKVFGDNSAILQADKIILATGSEPRSIAAFPFDGEKILDSTSLLERKELPKKLAIIGGGIIGCEFACLFNTFGVEVIVIEMLPRILPLEAPGISSALSKVFNRKGIALKTNAPVEKIDKNEKGVIVRLAGGESVEADIALVAVGRSLNTKDIGLEAAGVAVEENGMIKVNQHMQTSIDSIYAIGDIASKWWLAHVASHQGIVAANHACGMPAAMHYDAVPSAIFTVPEIGTVGLSLEEAIEKGYQATLGAFPFSALGKSQASLQTDGFAQIVVDKRTGQILGAQVMGYNAAALVAEMAVAIANELTVESIRDTIHAHPTIAEVWMEAAMAAEDSPLHIPLKRKRNDNA